VCLFTLRRLTYFTSLNLGCGIQWGEECFTVWVGPGGVANGALHAQRGWSEPEKWVRWECSVWSSACKDLYGQVVYVKNSLSTDFCRQRFNSTVSNIRPATAHNLSASPVEVTNTNSITLPHISVLWHEINWGIYCSWI